MAYSFPYLVIRIMPAIYKHEPIPEFKTEEAVINYALLKSKTENRRMCILFSKARSIYVEPNGSYEESTNSPKGGMTLKKDSER